MNLMADSGAILMTFTPFPLHKDFTPPSSSMCLKPLITPYLFLLVPCTYAENHACTSTVHNQTKKC